MCTIASLAPLCGPPDRYAPVSAADTYTARLGGMYGTDTAPKLPYVAGHDGVGVVITVRRDMKTVIGYFRV